MTTHINTMRAGLSGRAHTLALLGATLLGGSIIAGVVLSILGLAFTAFVIGVQTLAVFSAATKRSWEPLARISAGVGTLISGGALLGLGSYWWLAPVAVVGIIGWFAGRSVRRYMRPAVEMPADVLRRIASIVTLSDESVAGMRVGGRGDGAVVAFGYVSLSGATVAEDRGIQRFVADADAAREILGRSGAGHAEIVCVVDRAGVSESVSGYRIVGPDRVVDAVNAAKGPSKEALVEAAKAAGVELSRGQRRTIESGRTGQRGGGGKKIKHQGRVTKVEQG